MTKPKRNLNSARNQEGDCLKRQNAGGPRPDPRPRRRPRPRSRRRRNSSEEYTTDETTTTDEDIKVAVGTKQGKIAKPPRRWQPNEDDRLSDSVKLHGEANWKAIASRVISRNHVQCLQRWKKVLRPGLVKGQWSAKEDTLLMELAMSGYKNWGVLSNHMPGRTSKQCRERWCHHLDPTINKGAYSPVEDEIIIETQARIGNRWSQIASNLPGRTENSIKIRCKALQRMVASAGKGGGSSSNVGGSSSSGAGQSAPAPLRLTKQPPASSFSMGMCPPASSRKPGASRSSCASFVGNMAKQLLSKDGGRDNGSAMPKFCYTPSLLDSNGCSPRIGVGKMKPPSYMLSSNLSACAEEVPPFGMSQPSALSHRRLGKGKTLHYDDVSFPAPVGGAAIGIPPLQHQVATAPIPPSMLMSGSELDSPDWCWSLPRSTQAALGPAAKGLAPLSGRSTSTWPSPEVSVTVMTTTKDVKQQQQRVGNFYNYIPMKQSSSNCGAGSVLLDGAVATPSTSAVLPCSDASFEALDQPSLSQYFDCDLDSIIGPSCSMEEQGQICLTQLPVDSSESTTMDELLQQDPVSAVASELVVAKEKEEGDSMFREFKDLDVDDLEAVIGEKYDEAAAPLSSCCSFLDLPGEATVIGEISLPW